MRLNKLKLNKLNAPQAYHRVRRKVGRGGESPEAAGIPRITNETVAAHRQQVLSSARKYVFPLPHSKHRVVKVSVRILVVAIAGFLVWCLLALYHFQSTSLFMYDVSRVIPFPVAKAGPSFVSYESYLFELRHNMYYFESQQKVNFSTPDAKRQLAAYKKQALDTVITNAYVAQLAAKNHISVSDKEVNDEVALVRSENRLGSDNQVFENVLREFWGWSVADFKRELKQQLLAQKVVAQLDSGTHQRAQQALNELNHGAKFEDVAKKLSDDSVTKGQGGQYSGAISDSDRDVSPAVAAELFKLKPGQHSGIINSGYSLEIVKVLSKQGDKVKAAHIEFDFKDINTYINPLKDKNPPHRYIKV